jgi:hypothetical protein
MSVQRTHMGGCLLALPIEHYWRKALVYPEIRQRMIVLAITANCDTYSVAFTVWVVIPATGPGTFLMETKHPIVSVCE